MYEPPKTKESEQATALQTKPVGQRQPPTPLIDNRPEAAAQRKLCATANNSPQVMQQMARSQAIANSQVAAIQQKKMDSLFGGTQLQRADESSGGHPNEASTQLMRQPASTEWMRQPASKPDNTGLPSQLKSGIESISGMSMDHVKVHYNSSQPAQLNAHAYAQGSTIHIAPGQERHLPHEAWHVVQQAQGRVQPTRQMKGAAVNDNPGLEAEADTMGARAMAAGSGQTGHALQLAALRSPSRSLSNAPIQGDTLIDGTPGTFLYDKGKHSETTGLHAWAYLDPNKPANGSGPADSALNGTMSDLKHLGYQSMIKGHLINGQLGGPGLAANLYPITSQANSRHKLYAENYIKEKVTERKGSGWGVYYSVEVTDAKRTSGSPSAAFTCEAYDWNISKGQNKSAVVMSSPVLKPLDIESAPALGSTGSGTVTPLTIGVNAFGNKFNYKSYEPESLSFANAKLASGWGEKGSGKGSGGRDWSHLSSDMEP